MDLRIDVARLRRESPGLLAELLNYRGELRFRQARFQEALGLHRESVNVLLEIPQQGDASIALYLYNVATDLTKMGRLRSALPVYEQALDVCAKSLGEEHPIYGELLKNYSTALRKLGYKREAKLAITRTEEIKRISLRRNGTGLTISAPALSSITR